MTLRLSRFALALGMLIAFSSCYGGKMLRGPINAEKTMENTDSLLVEQARVFRELTTVKRQLAEEREERARYQAMTTTRLAELDESIRILISQITDSNQRSRQSRRRPPVDPVPTVTRATDSTDTTGTIATGGTEEELYRAAYLDLTRGNYDLSAQGFQSYLASFPYGDRVDEAHYYLGECYFANDRHLEAVGEYQFLIREISESRLVPAAYLKSGRCYIGMEEKNLAAKAFQTLVDDYPDTEEAAQARTALQELKGS